MRNLLLFIFIILSINTFGHDKYSLSGLVVDEKNQPMVGVHVFLDESVVASNLEGKFTFRDLETGDYQLKCNFIGYKTYLKNIIIIQDTSILIKLIPDLVNLQEVVILDKKEVGSTTLKTEALDSDEILKRYSGSFIKSIESLVGVNAMDIGASMSKPMIRGMGFNRIVVAENGVKQEGQQWGADHGLEIDPFNVEKASIVKGASSIEYGSDAIGGVINIENSKVPQRYSFSGDVSFLAKSINHTLGGSVFTQYRGDKYYFKLRGTLLDFGDYVVPTEQIDYLGYNIPIYNNKLKNTAGSEKDFNIVGGYLSDKFRSSLSVSLVNQINGFFPGSHGKPDLERLVDDGKRRNIDYPYQETSHFKIISNTVWVMAHHDIHLDIGLQENFRQEWSKFHTHFVGQTPPEINPDLELDFNLRTYSINGKYHFHISDHNLTVGSQNQYQQNNISGYNFFLPRYSRITNGLFIKDDIKLSNNLNLSLGLRYDWGENKIDGFYDSLLHRDLVNRGFADQADFYAQRSIPYHKSDQNISWLAGMTYRFDQNWNSRLNIGKSYRLPLAIELGSNGIHHGSFRHELGNPSLDSEVGYYLDFSLEYSSESLSFSFNPYIYYFPNYLFLNPTGNWSFLAHAGQIYEYDQSEAFLSGLEMAFNKSIGSKLKFSTNFEYLVNQQLSGDSRYFSMPFTPPLNGFSEIVYSFGRMNDPEKSFKIFFNSKYALRQNKLAKNEKTTPGFGIFGMGVETDFILFNNPVNLTLQGQNIFNTKYFNHISFYRKLEIPEPGRNIQLLMKIPINRKGE